VAFCEQGKCRAEGGQFVHQAGDHPFHAAVELQRNSLCQRGELGDPHRNKTPNAMRMPAMMTAGMSNQTASRVQSDLLRPAARKTGSFMTVNIRLWKPVQVGHPEAGELSSHLLCR
jgi:hypothetical protein